MTNTPAQLIASLRKMIIADPTDDLRSELIQEEGDSIIDDIEESYRDEDDTYDFLLSYPLLPLRAWFEHEITEGLSHNPDFS